MCTENIYIYTSTIEILILYYCMYTKYNCIYTSTKEILLLYHTLIHVCILNKITYIRVQ